MFAYSYLFVYSMDISLMTIPKTRQKDGSYASQNKRAILGTTFSIVVSVLDTRWIQFAFGLYLIHRIFKNTSFL